MRKKIVLNQDRSLPVLGGPVSYSSPYIDEVIAAIASRRILEIMDISILDSLITGQDWNSPIDPDNCTDRVTIRSN